MNITAMDLPWPLEFFSCSMSSPFSKAMVGPTEPDDLEEQAEFSVCLENTSICINCFEHDFNLNRCN